MKRYILKVNGYLNQQDTHYATIINEARDYQGVLTFRLMTHREHTFELRLSKNGYLYVLVSDLVNTDHLCWKGDMVGWSLYKKDLMS